MLGPEDLAQGIDTIDKKLEKDCRGFRRLEVLYGGRQNVRPSSVLTNDDDGVSSHQLTHPHKDNSIL